MSDFEWGPIFPNGKFESRTLIETNAPSRRISGINDNGEGYDITIPTTCKFDNVNQKCNGNCNNDENCTLKRIKQRFRTKNNDLDIDDDEDDIDFIVEKIIMNAK